MAYNNDTGPLGKLEKQGYSLESFTYPIDLTTDPGEQHFVVFYINESNNTQYHTINRSGQLSSSGTSVTPLDSSGNQAIPTANSTDNVTTYPRPTRRVSTAIALYYPPNIQTTYSTSWDSFEGNASMGIADILNKNSGSAGTFGKIASEAGIGVAKGFLDDVAGKLRGKGINASPEEMLNLTTRAARNPHMEMIFKSIGFRKFQFDFKFTPRSEQEAVIVANIIKAFKFYSAPEIKVADNVTNFFIFPAEFDIEFWSNGRQNTFLNKISSCACTDITVNYTSSGGWSAFKPGALIGTPVETSLSLQFTELEVLGKSRIKTGF